MAHQPAVPWHGRHIDDSHPGKENHCYFFLVDAMVRIRSAATVPPQRLSWVTKMTHPILERIGFSEEIAGKIVDYLTP